jgi:predicted restriction endonuclease
MTMAGQTWTRNETLVAFNIYCRTPFGRLHARNPEIVEVANALGRTANSVAMKCCNLAAFDSALQERGIKGLSKTSRTDAEVWEQFNREPEEVAFESEQAYSSLMGRELRSEPEVRWEDVQGLDKSVITKVRVNQYLFRSIVLAGYRAQCAVCELPLPSLLVASHIVPWSIDKAHRMNPHNGICLCAIHDRAFDKGLLGIGADYKVSIHATVWKADKTTAVKDYFLRFDGQCLVLPDRWHPDPALLKRHTEVVANSNA